MRLIATIVVVVSAVLASGCSGLPGGSKAPGTVQMVGLQFADVPLPWQVVSKSDLRGEGRMEYGKECHETFACPELLVVSAKNTGWWKDYVKDDVYVGSQKPCSSRFSPFKAPVAKGTVKIDGADMLYYESPPCKVGGGVRRAWHSTDWRVLIVATPDDKGFFPIDDFKAILDRTTLVH